MSETGTHQVWRGGLHRPDSQFNILSLAWRGSDNHMLFAAQWCSPLQAEPYSFVCAGGDSDLPTWADAPVRQLAATGGGGTLAASQVLLRLGRHGQALAQAIMGSSRNSLLVLLVGSRYAVPADPADRQFAGRRDAVGGARPLERPAGLPQR